jgi:L-fuconolactonase
VSGTPAERTIDSHVHIWDLAVSQYDWLGPEHGPLNRTFGAEEASEVLAASRVDRAILVQAEDSVADTRHMLAAMAEHPTFVGVVGWVRLDDPHTAISQLGDYGRSLCGLRHLTHVDERPDFLSLATVRASLAAVAEAGLPLDVPDAWPRHFSAMAELADEAPSLTIVLDHLGKPPRHDPDAMTVWEQVVSDLALRPNVVAKFSGLQRSGCRLQTSDLRPVLDVALDAFGASRLMYGGDWPMTASHGGYAPVWTAVSALVGELSGAEQQSILRVVAERTYGVATADAAPPL